MLALLPFVPGFAAGRLLPGLSDPGEPHIAVADQAQLSDLRLAPHRHLQAVIVVGAAPLSHPVLKLRGWGVPVVLLHEPGPLPWGEQVWLDAAAGRLSTVPLNPPRTPPPAPASLHTADGTPVTLLASVGSVEAVRMAVSQGASGIGLFRSEYLVPGTDTPPEMPWFEAQLDAVCEAAAGRMVTVRLLDVAGDKRPPWLPKLPGATATLGVQGVRLYDFEPVQGVVRAELDALAVLAARYPLRVLLPYVTRREEVEHWAGEVRRRARIPLGVMLETPAAALAVDSLLEVADFAVLGCNDLMQCLFAANRDEPLVARQLDFHAPVLYRFLGMIIERAGDADRLQVNGLLTQWPGAMTLLLGLGYRRFSVDPALVPWIAEAIGHVDLTEARRLARQATGLRRAGEVRALLGI